MLGASDTYDGRGRLIERAGKLPMTFDGAPPRILEGRLAAIPLVAIAVFDAATRTFSGRGHQLEAHAEATYIAMFVLHFVAVGLYCGLWMVDRRSWREQE
jgi:hypothetical protein